MRTDEQRITKYLAKTDPATMSLKVGAMLELMRARYASAAQHFVPIELATKGIIDEEGAKTHQYPFYLAFARQLAARTYRSVSGDALLAEAQAIKDHWEARGFTDATLKRIALDVFNLTLT